MNSEIMALLAKVSVLVNKNEEFQQRTGNAFNVFDVCGVEHYETKHSAILAAFLTPSGTHGLGKTFLQTFLDKVLPDYNCEISESATVRTEVPVDSNMNEASNPDSRIDILIEDSVCKTCIVVENKIYADEGWKQIARYRSWLDRERIGYKCFILFLTLDGDAPWSDSEAVGSNVCLQCASWRSHVTSWLRDCARLAFDRPFVRETLLQYANLINRLSGESIMSEEQKKEIVELATSNVASLRGTVNLFRQKGAIYNNVVGKIALELKLRLSSISDWEFLGFEKNPFGQKEQFIRLKHVQSSVCVRIAPELRELRKFFIGFSNSDAGQLADDIHKQVFKMAGWKQTTSWLGWKYLPDSILDWQGDFLVDYLDGDKRHVIESLMEELKVVHSLLSSRV